MICRVTLRPHTFLNFLLLPLLPLVGATDIQFVEVFSLLERLCKFVMSVAVIFFTTDAYTPSVFVFIFEAVLLYAWVKLMPCEVSC